jgi:hypothetical protein
MRALDPRIAPFAFGRIRRAKRPTVEGSKESIPHLSTWRNPTPIPHSSTKRYSFAGADQSKICDSISSWDLNRFGS